jgi:hypothetical protein
VAEQAAHLDRSHRAGEDAFAHRNVQGRPQGPGGARGASDAGLVFALVGEQRVVVVVAEGGNCGRCG